MRRYRKPIKIFYEYIDSPESENALAEVFDDIFKRLIQKRKNKVIPYESSILTIA